MSDETPEVRPVWTYTSRVRKHANESPDGSTGGGPYGSYRNRHIIGRDSRILGGIAIVYGHPVLIVVSETDEELPRTWETLRLRVARDNTSRLGDLLATVSDVVRESIPYDHTKTEWIRRRESPSGEEVKIPLAMHVAEKAGTCWEQGLLAAYLIEKLIDNGYIGGSVSTDRNIKRDTLGEWVKFAVNGSVGHQWARYTAPNGTVYVVDVAQGYCGRLADVDRSRRGFWRDYDRPEDKPPKPSRPPLHDEIDYVVAAGGLLWLAWHFFF